MHIPPNIPLIFRLGQRAHAGSILFTHQELTGGYDGGRLSVGD
jgi:hypothetical protein